MPQREHGNKNQGLFKENVLALKSHEISWGNLQFCSKIETNCLVNLEKTIWSIVKTNNHLLIFIVEY